MQLSRIMNKISHLLDDLHKYSLKVTPVRLNILNILLESDKPLDSSSIKLILNRYGVKADRATIFRTINSFSKKGLIKEVNLGESKMRYEYSGRQDHHHLLCQRCGEIEDIYNCKINLWEKEILNTTGFQIRHHDIEFFGLCRQCQKYE